MPVMPTAACAAPLSCTPPSVEALKPKECIDAKSVDVKRYMPRVASPAAGGGAGAGAGAAAGGLGDGDGEGDGVGVGAAGEGDSTGDARIGESAGLDLARATL
jgi:hypothetical protein